MLCNGSLSETFPFLLLGLSLGNLFFDLFSTFCTVWNFWAPGLSQSKMMYFQWNMDKCIENYHYLHHTFSITIPTSIIFAFFTWTSSVISLFIHLDNSIYVYIDGTKDGEFHVSLITIQLFLTLGSVWQR